MIGRLLRQRTQLAIRRLATTTEAMVKLVIDGKEVSVPKGTMLIEAIKKAGSSVPYMCYHPDVSASGGLCRICLVESVQKPEVPIISCKTPVAEGMQIVTQGRKIAEYRQTNAAMMFSTHPSSCLSCPSSTRCQGQALASKTCIAECGLNNILPACNTGETDQSTPIYRDKDRCINCDICVHTCKMQGVGALSFYNQEGHTVESMGELSSSECVQCGQCINRCPTGALTERSEIRPVLEAIKDPKKHVVFQMAPAIRASIAEEFGCKPGERILKNEVVTALKKLGPNVTVLDTDFTADLTIMEEGYELIERLYRAVTGKKLNGGDHMVTELPMFTSCCPGWIIFVEKNYPDMVKHLSTTKSPMQMLSALSKSYWAKSVKKVDPKTVVNVAIMPCTAKKQEKDRPDMKMDYGDPATDYVLTTRELGKMLRQANLDPTKLPKTPFDKIMGESTGAAVIFGATGGVMEAALRTAYEVLTGRPVPFKNLNIEAVRGMEGIREAAIKLENLVPTFKAFEGVTLKVAVAHGIQNARKVMEIVRQAKLAGQPAPWHFIEIMACPGGCVGGGGQPKPTDMEIRKERTKLIFKEDMDLPLRKSHDNPEITALYKDFLKEPLGHHSHHLLHRTYLPSAIRGLDTYPAADVAGVDEILAKYPREQQYLLPIIIEESDKKGYISDAALIKISQHLNMYPAQVDAILSSYHYFPRKNTSNTHIYLCRCHNCMMKGQAKAIRAIEEKYGITNCHGGVANDKSFTFHTLNWLGWCVNDAPSMMIKRAGSSQIEMLFGYNESSILQQLAHIPSGQFKTLLTPAHNIEERSIKRLGSAHSFLEDRVNIAQAVHKATTLGPNAVIREILDSGLVGRGGAGFKTGIKWQSAKDAQASEKYVVCNADEGLPSTYKDWCILRNQERRKEVLTGMGICARTIGAQKCFLYLRYEYRNLVSDITADIKAVQSQCPELADLKYEVRLGAGPYVAGEENAQFESIAGAAPLPRKDRPSTVFPTVEGLFHKPTVINNVETFWAVPHIVTQGGKSFGPQGLPKLLSVTGDVSKPILLECSLQNYTLENLIHEVGARDIVAAEVGGCTESIIFKDQFATKFGFGRGVLNAVGSVVLFNSSRDVLDLYQEKLHFMAEESCKQCVPCRDGARLLGEGFHELRTGQKKVDPQSLQRAAETAGATSICAHGKALHPLFQSALEYLTKHPPTRTPI